MAISYIRGAESHTGASLAVSRSISEASFTFAVGQAGDSPKGVLVFTYTMVSSTETATSVTYGGSTLSAVSGASAADTSTEPGRCTAWFLGSSVPSGAKSVVVNRTNNTNIMYAIGVILGGARDTRVVGTPQLGENNAAIAALTVDDGLGSGQTSIALAGAYYGGNTAPTAATNCTLIASIPGATGAAYSCAGSYETTPTYGSRARGLVQATSDDRAYVVLCVTDEALPVFAGGAPFIGGGWY